MADVAELSSPSHPPWIVMVNVTARLALPKNRVVTLISSHANYEIKTKMIYVYNIILFYEKYSTLNLYSYKINRNTKLHLSMKQ